MSRLRQASFTGGEIDPDLRKRSDLDRYQVSVAEATNMIVLPHGPIMNRPGTRLVVELDIAKRERLFEFKFNSAQTYAMLFREGEIRFATNGGLVVWPASPNPITNATQANPCHITQDNEFGDGDSILITGIVGMVELNGRYFEVVNRTPTGYDLLGENSTAYTAYASGGSAGYDPALVGTPVVVTTDYTEEDIFGPLQTVPAADVVTILSHGRPPRELKRRQHHSWQLVDLIFAPSIGPPTSGLGATGNGPNGDPKGWRYVVTSVSEDTGEESVKSAEITITYTLDANNTITVDWNAVTGAARYFVYRKQNGEGNYGLIGMADGQNSFKDTNFKAEYGDVPRKQKTLFEAEEKYPTVGNYYQQRLVLANTIKAPTTIYGSVTGSFKSYTIGTPIADDDAVIFTLAERERNEIRHLVALKHLLVFTSGAEFRLQGVDGGPVTPTSIDIKPQSYVGSSWVRPIVIEQSVLFVQDKGSRIYDLTQTDQDGYTGNELSVFARHLFRRCSIIDWTFAKTPHSVVWIVCDDGRFHTLSYLKEHAVWGFAHQETKGKVESMLAVSEGEEDATYMIVRRKIAGTWRRFLERFASRDFDEPEDAYFVDCGLSLDVPVAVTAISNANPIQVTAPGHGLLNGDHLDLGSIEPSVLPLPIGKLDIAELNGKRFVARNISANTFTLEDEYTGAGIDGAAYAEYDEGGVVRKAVATLSGLAHLEGETVTYLANGNSGTAVVSGGAITLARRASRVHVGIGYTSRVRTLPIDLLRAQRGGGSDKGSSNKAVLFINDTSSFFAGQEGCPLYPAKIREFEDWNEPTSTSRYYAEIDIQGAWEREPAIVVEQREPKALKLVAVEAYLSL